MGSYTVAIVGTGPDPESAEHEGYSMGYRHARSYRDTDGCRVHACADVVPEHARDFAEAFDLPAGRTYEDHATMLEDAEPDIVSVCTPPATHLELVTDCARHDAVSAIHCEKPMAPTFGDSRRLVSACAENDVQLTVNLQNRCGPLAAEAKALVEDGAIGRLERVELGRNDLLQTGIHHVDLANFVLGDEPIEWVIGQIDYPEERIWYTDMHAEHQGLGLWQYESGVHAFASTGAGEDVVGSSTNRLLGTDGEIEIDVARGELRTRTAESGSWNSVDVEGPSAQDGAIEEVVAGLETGREPIVSGAVGLAATEVVFAIWESARRRGRVSLPLAIEDNPLADLVARGELPPNA